MVRLKRISMVIVFGQILFVIVLVRTIYFKGTENNTKISTYHRYVTIDKARSVKTIGDQSQRNQLQISLGQNRITPKTSMSRNIEEKMQIAGVSKLFKRSNAAGTSDLTIDVRQTDLQEKKFREDSSGTVNNEYDSIAKTTPNSVTTSSRTNEHAIKANQPSKDLSQSKGSRQGFLSGAGEKRGRKTQRSSKNAYKKSPSSKHGLEIENGEKTLENEVPVWSAHTSDNERHARTSSVIKGEREQRTSNSGHGLSRGQNQEAPDSPKNSPLSEVLENNKPKYIGSGQRKDVEITDEIDLGNVDKVEFESANQKSNSGDNEKTEEGVLNASDITDTSPMSMKDMKQADFVRNWCRVQKARTDWESILKPCKDNTVWGRNTMDHHPPTSARTSFISKWEIKPVGSYSRFVVQSMSDDNVTKSIGGDSWRVHLRGPATIGPTVFDHNNGTYEMVFLVMEPGKYQVDMWLDYTLCNGLKDPPPHWFRSGNVQGKNQPDGILKGDKPFLIQKFRPHELQPSFDVVEDPIGFKPAPGQAGCSCPSLHWDGLGRWAGNKTLIWKPYLKENVTARNHSHNHGDLIIYGDSVTGHFQESIVQGPYQEVCYKTFKSCRRVYNWVYNMKGYWGKKNEHREPGPDGKDYDHERVLNDAREVLYEPTMDANSVLFLNWGIHFAAVTSFNNYRRLIEEFAKIIKHGETDSKTGEYKKFKGHFFWKTTTAINRHRFPYPHKDVRRFLTFPRIVLFNAFATSIMCQSGIDVIDVYPISDAYPKGTLSNQDPVHYGREVFRDVERLLVETFPLLET